MIPMKSLVVGFCVWRPPWKPWRVLHVDHWMEHCLSLHVHGDDSAESLFTLEGGDLRVSVINDLTNPYPIEPVWVGGGVVCGQCATCGHKRAD